MESFAFHDKIISKALKFCKSAAGCTSILVQMGEDYEAPGEDIGVLSNSSDHTWAFGLGL